MARGPYEEAPAKTIDADTSYDCVLTTTAGEVHLHLLPELAPKAVNSFIFLAAEGYYDGCTFHRVVPGFIAQSGDPSGRGSGGPGYRLADELSEHSFTAGTVGMANPSPGQNGSQFFVVLSNAPHLDRRFTVLGEVTAGLEVLQALPARSGDDSEEPAGLRIDAVAVTGS